MIRNIVFDFDMTLVDSSQGITDCINEVSIRKGLPSVTREQVLSIVGIPLEKGLHRLWGEYDESWLIEYRNIFRDTEYAGIVPFKNTLETLKKLHGKGVKLAVATNRNLAEHVVRAVGLYGNFDAVFGLEGKRKPKPEPDVILAAMDYLGGLKTETLYVGDTDIDMKAAVNAGVRGVGMTTGNFNSQDLLLSGAWKTLEDIAGLVDFVKEDMEGFCYGKQA